MDFKTQERYYTKIVERYLSFCSDAGDGDSLLKSFKSLSIANDNGQAVPPFPTPSSTAGTKGLSDVLMALRKLREGIVASKRADDFATQAYLFCIRLALLVKNAESYHPAILHLLRFIHSKHPLTTFELREVTGYLVLDAACRRGDLDEAFYLRNRYKLRDSKVDGILKALAHDNYVAFRKIKRSVDGHKAKLMEFSEADMRRHTLKCFGRTYLSVDVEFLEKSTGSSWSDLVTDGVGWQLDGRKVVVRSIKGRT